jgi:hypothetical protein
LKEIKRIVSHKRGRILSIAFLRKKYTDEELKIMFKTFLIKRAKKNYETKLHSPLLKKQFFKLILF